MSDHKSCGQSSWLQIQRPGFDSRRYNIFWEVVGLERGPLKLVSKTEELLERKSSGSGLESREYDRRDPSCWLRGSLYPQKFALPSMAWGGRSVGIVRSLTQVTEFFFFSLDHKRQWRHVTSYWNPRSESQPGGTPVRPSPALRLYKTKQPINEK
jgi:hypothetical protein